MLDRRRFSLLAAAAAGTAAWPRVAFAETYPARPVRLVVPFAAGGATDVIARTLADQIGKDWKQQLVVENKPGAGSNIGIEQVARAEPDGHTILIASIGLAVNRYLYKTLGYDPLASFAPVSLICHVPNVMAVPPDSPAKSVQDFIAKARAAPGKLTFASSGIGTSLHLSGELFQRMAGVKLTHVPYRGSAPALNDLMGGRVDVIFDNITSILPQVQGGTVRALAVTSARRVPAAQDLPTIAESGVPGFDVSSWFALFAPAKTPADIVTKLQGASLAALAAPAVRKRLEDLGALVVGSSQAELTAHLQSEMDKWGKLIAEGGIKIE
ncbi:tripartite tricarboxylate transporter substrate binding protein [Chelatococcus sp. SYSU_G07232]|uniref:Tripartite tricarboxylate transporter substrate binding protein n=1 Tax=Chelatococcus albus TaxID=3047466 RepID=A0ABT7AKI0_9HYPH|nr:tripartite tricarboxylate transporter substrate binding protein [Chelatococcus sp. SYSU_G07232]MDJ1159875.1 tripartite tricarboxylate transporter substrate binding protein [Chelatococcus sp. SYSU_G07232]